jgi:exosortase
LKPKTDQMARGMVLVVLLGIGAALYWSTIVSLLTVSSNKELYSHIPLIPFVSLYFFFMQREGIFSQVRWDGVKGLPIIVAGFLVYRLGRPVEGMINEHNTLSFMMFGFFLWILGGFLLTYGASACRKAVFPLLFLLFIIPIPTPILDPFVRFLQLGAAEFSHAVFKLTGVPFHRDGMFFSLPGLTVEVAEQCSGIRSTIALFITAILAGKLFLEKGWARLVLVLSVFPISMFKNALRIVMLSLLGAYLDPRFITGSWLHSSGGIPFFVVALLFLLPVFWGIRKWEKAGSGERGEGRWKRGE